MLGVFHKRACFRPFALNFAASVFVKTTTRQVAFIETKNGTPQGKSGTGTNRHELKKKQGNKEVKK
jgi:hypothetical protein